METGSNDGVVGVWGIASGAVSLVERHAVMKVAFPKEGRNTVAVERYGHWPVSADSPVLTCVKTEVVAAVEEEEDPYLDLC